MVLHTRGRVGRRQLFYKPLSTDLLREAFFCVNFLEARPHQNWGHRVLTWGRRVPEAADKIAFYRVNVFLFELF